MEIRHRYLVRNLTIYEGGVVKKLSLHYIKLCGNALEVLPFDKERAGFIYIPQLTVKKDGDFWKFEELRTD